MVSLIKLFVVMLLSSNIILSNTCTGSLEEMCLSLEHQNPSKTSENMADFDRVTVSLHILYIANQETEGSQDRLGKQPPRSTKL